MKLALNANAEEPLESKNIELAKQAYQMQSQTVAWNTQSRMMTACSLYTANQMHFNVIDNSSRSHKYSEHDSLNFKYYPILIKLRLIFSWTTQKKIQARLLS